jgi:hypothetical protein
MPQHDPSLGNFVFGYTGGLRQFTFLMFASILTLVGGIVSLMLAIGLTAGDPNYLGIIIISAIMIIIGLALGIYGFIERRTRVNLYVNGLEYFYLNAHATVRWNSVATVHYRFYPNTFDEIFRFIGFIGGVLMKYLYRFLTQPIPGLVIVSQNGQELRIPLYLGDIDLLAYEVQKRIADHQIPRIMTQIETGESHEYHQLSVSKRGFLNTNQSLEWQAVSSINSVGYSLTIFDGTGKWAVIDLAKYPNGVIFRGVVDGCYKRYGKTSQT